MPHCELRWYNNTSIDVLICILHAVWCAVLCVLCAHYRPVEYVPDESGLNHMPQYDLDELDLGWLKTIKERRKYSGMCVCVCVCVCVCACVCV